MWCAFVCRLEFLHRPILTYSCIIIIIIIRIQDAGHLIGIYWINENEEKQKRHRHLIRLIINSTPRNMYSRNFQVLQYVCFHRADKSVFTKYSAFINTAVSSNWSWNIVWLEYMFGKSPFSIYTKLTYAKYNILNIINPKFNQPNL